MNEDKKLGQLYQFSPWELEGTPLNPSDLIRQREARMVGRMAEEAHLMGRRFVDWPTITLRQGDVMRYEPMMLRAEVVARKVL